MLGQFEQRGSVDTPCPSQMLQPKSLRAAHSSPLDALPPPSQQPHCSAAVPPSTPASSTCGGAAESFISVSLPLSLRSGGCPDGAEQLAVPACISDSAASWPLHFR